ncbi:hypothetical protein [Brevibacillus parabrevis]|jgi:hypothetical protein|uniref:hypothetical protein n=1 Tax=Brevibacillus parabrevis TaxID=54914 RepID=UPI00248F7795|nr:hypothetical protein [Brevibacillus parabrevis]
MDDRKTVCVEKMIIVMKSQGMDASMIEGFLQDVRQERKNAPTTANSEGIQNNNVA